MIFISRITFNTWFSFFSILMTLMILMPATTVAALMLDEFDGPTSTRSAVAYGIQGSSTATVAIRDSELSVPGGVRDVILDIYDNPLNSAALIAVGEGRLSVAQGTGTMARMFVTYGASTHPDGDPQVGGPYLQLDLSSFNSFILQLSGAEEEINVIVGFYTSSPLNGSEIFYNVSDLNVSPSTPGGALTVTFPVSNDPTFNWGQVDGIFVLINGAGPIPHTSYTLDSLQFTP